jgi:hypothetical protein
MAIFPLLAVKVTGAQSFARPVHRPVLGEKYFVDLEKNAD